MVRVRRLNGMVFRKQDRERPCLFPFLDLGNSGASFGGLAGRRPGQRKIELDREAGAFARFAAQADPAAHQVYQASADTLLMSPGSVLRQAASLVRRRASRSVRLRSPGKRKGEPPLGADVPRTSTGLLWRRNEKRALRPFLNALQTSLELYRSIFGAGDETCTRTVSRCFPNTFFVGLASEDLNCSLVFRPRQQIRPKSSTDVQRAALSTPDPRSVHRRRRLPRTHHPRPVVCPASIIVKTIRQMVLVMAQVGCWERLHHNSQGPSAQAPLKERARWPPRFRTRFFVDISG